ncbi:MAG: cellulase family glycosylhydrolase [Salinivirgaceae bacterium]|nr:cellulase family glycosylhydrolase [Salinivirgaceae bacterium]
MKKILISIALLYVGIFLLSAQSVYQHGRLNVQGTQLVDSAGKPIILRGMSFGWHNWWPRFYNTDAVAWLADDWKVTAVRAAMGIEPTGGYLTDSVLAVTKIKAVIEGAIEQGIYVIIDWHSHNINLTEAKAFFKYMAETYGHTPNVIYEIFNEPDEESWAEVKAYSIEIIETIRAIDPDNIILVGSPNWDQDLNVVADDPITGYSNLMYTMHFYAGTHGQWLRDRCDYALGKGIPIMVSESAGTEASGDGTINYTEWNAFIQWMEQNQISWFCWSIADKDESSAVLNTTASSTGNWSEADLKQSGKDCRNLFRKYHYNYEPSRIYQAMAKGRRGEDLKIGVIGGSITAGYAASTENKRWANLMADWWETKFPESSVTLINAGWGGTGSDIGVHRAYDDLLVQNPDFVVIEFSVNDSEGELATKMMEGLVQQLILAESQPGIMILMLKQDNGTTAQASHKPVGNYYQVPMVSFADLIDAQVAEDGITLSSIFVDGLHPNDVGMNYIADFIKERLDSIYATLPADAELPEVNTELPVPLIATTYSNTFQFFYNNIIPYANQGWEIASTGWSTEVAGNQIDFKVMGNAISLVYTQNDDTFRGKAEVWVDGGTKTIIDAHMTDDWGTKYSYVLVQEGLEDGEHILHIKTIEETNTSGHYVHIARVLVAGNTGSAAPIALTSSYQKGVVNKALEFDGTESFDPDGETLSGYSWTVSSRPANSTAAIQNATNSIASFTPDVAGEYVVDLIVASGFNTSVPAKKRLAIKATNAIPVPVAGNDTLSALNKYFKFDGSASSDADGDALTYKWVLESAPEGSSTYIMKDDYVKPQCKFDIEGEYVISLTVSDSIDVSEKDYIKVTAKEGYTGILEPDEKNRNQLYLFPNPTSGPVTLEFYTELNQPSNIQIFSVIGSKIGEVKSLPKNIGWSSLSINLKDFSQNAGIYFIKIIQPGRQIISRLTLQ